MSDKNLKRALIASSLLHLILISLLIFAYFNKGGSGDGDDKGKNKGKGAQHDPVEIVPKIVEETQDKDNPITVTLKEAKPKSDKDRLKQKCTSNQYYGGIGVKTRISDVNNAQYVESAAEGYPAYNAGIKRGDILISLDDDIRGEPGTIATILLIRNGVQETIQLVREKICVEHSLGDNRNHNEP